VTERQLDVAKTEIVAPFDCRLSEVNVELNQYAAVGSLMLKAESIHRAEIPVQIPPQKFMTLLPKMSRSFMPGQMNMEMLRKAIGITALVRLPINKGNVTWEGRFSRTSESMDMTTGAVTIYVTVDDPYDNVIPGKRPPLLTNMYVAVELRGKPLSDQNVVPATAVYGNRVYIVGTDNRLKIKPVNVAWVMGDLAVLEPCEKNHVNSEIGHESSIGCIAEPGEMLVLSDLVPAIEGMLLNPVLDDAAALRLRDDASGAQSSKDNQTMKPQTGTSATPPSTQALETGGEPK